MTFESDKKTILSKIDKSKKGSIDKEILKLINKINKSPNYYTTSSCAGRILVISKKSVRKNQAEWLFLTHKTANLKQVKNALRKLPNSEIWFKQEPPILHVVARTIEDAQDLVNIVRSIGFKRSGIQSTKKKITIEIGSTEVIATIIADKGRLLVNDDYLKVLIQKANKKLENSRKKIKNLYKHF